MNRRTDPKARNQLSEAAATGRRRAQVQEHSSRQRDATLRSRRLLAELAGGSGCGDEGSEGALAALGPDVLSERIKVVATLLARWREVPPVEWQGALQQLATLLSTGVHQAVQAALDCQVVPTLAALLQLPPSQLPPDAVRRAAWALELAANDSPGAAREVLTAAPVVVSRLSASLAVVGAPERQAGLSEELLEADQMAAALGAVAAWGPELQGLVVAHCAPVPLLQLLLVVLEGAAEASAAVAAVAAAAAAETGMQPEGGDVAAAGEPPAVRCCASALWSLGMVVRGRSQEILQLVTQQPLLLSLRRLLLAPGPYPTLLREAAWLLAFCSAGGGSEAVTALVEGGGLVPGLLLSTMRYVQQAAALSGDDPTSHDAAQPLHQALLPLLLTLTNIAAEPAQALPLLSELQAVRPLLPSPRAAGTASVAAAAGGGPIDLTASGMQALVACLEGRVSHRGVVRGAAALAAGLAWGASRAGAVAVNAVRGALQDAGVVAALVGLLRGAALDIRKEAAAALTSLCQGAGNGDGDGGAGAAGGGCGPGSLDMLRSLGIDRGGDEHGVLAAFLGLLRSPDADAVHAGLRFVTLVLGGVKRGPQLVENLDGIDALEAVQYGTSGCRVPELQAWAEELVDLHYGENYGEDDEDDCDDRM